ncbi:DCC1-like thiol-disulfide oxidoreductase family protein [Spirillospora sp. NPDC047279]|uniref:DCC1-like thiol-disulfide oxidoreductase family protein n=1 Tax=Spirillospora sp. NPDC047279 TaxID=3155478 RepID=UPI0033D517BF
MTPRRRPVLVFDGDCGFCSSSVRFMRRRIPTSAEAVPYQSADLAALGTSVEQASYEVVWVARDGRTHGGALGVAKMLVDAGGVWRPLGLIAQVPPFRWLAHGLYRLIAANRGRLPGGTPACALPKDALPKDALPNDSQAKDAQPKDAQAKDAQAKDAQAKDAQLRNGGP